VAPSFIRFGNFEILAARGDTALLRQLSDFTIARDFPGIDPADPTRYAQWFAEVCERTATMIVGWMRVGFVHGVMNTDNMSILGLTIDYGPYGWLDDFDPQWTPNTTDAGGRRYRYGHQPAIAQWNLERLADALQPLFDGTDALVAGLALYVDRFNDEYRAMLAAKFGLPSIDGVDGELASSALDLLAAMSLDHTNFFRALGDLPATLPNTDEAMLGLLGDIFYDDAQRVAQAPALAAWLRQWHPRAQRGAPMQAVNPKYILRNYLAQEAIDAATAGDASLVQTLLEVMRRPYDDQPTSQRFAAKRPEWARDKAGCSMLSCSS
jgi:uncharacterized protein YdiU (UPF0061 family)